MLEDVLCGCFLALASTVRAPQFWKFRRLVEDKTMWGLLHIQKLNQVCEGCLLEKHHRNTFPKESMTRANKSLELTHVDVCGVMKLKSHGKSKYFLLFIDDFSRRTWVYFLKEKLEVFEIFKRFKARVENESNLRNQGHENRSRW